MKRMLSLLFSLFPFVCVAYDVEVDGLYYNLNNEDLTAEVTYGIIDGKKITYRGHIDIPEFIEYSDHTYKITSVGKSAFSGSANLYSVSIGENIERLETGCFQSCTALSTIVIPQSVKYIDYDSFSECTKLYDIYCEAEPAICNPYQKGSGYQIYFGVFSQVPKDCHLYVKQEYIDQYKNAPVWSSFANIDETTSYNCICIDELCYDLDQKNLQAIVSKPKKINVQMYYSGHIEIPSSVIFQGLTYEVGSIGSAAFQFSDISSVSIPSTIKTVASYAFYNCRNLKSVLISEGVKVIGYNAFSYTSIEQVYIPNSVTTVGDYAFQYCSSLKNVTLNHTITTVAPGLFFYCTSLKNIIIPNNITSLGEAAFQGCSSLESVTIGANVSKVDYYVFYDCYKLSKAYYLSGFSKVMYRKAYQGYPHIYVPVGYKILPDSFYSSEGYSLDEFDTRDANHDGVIDTADITTSVIIGCDVEPVVNSILEKKDYIDQLDT